MEETCGNVITEMAASTGVYDNKTVKSNEIREGTVLLLVMELCARLWRV